MKKTLLIILCFVFIIGSLLLINFSQTKTTSADAVSGYAQVLYSNVYLYKYPTDVESYENRHFLLEPTYFVKVEDKANDFFYKVSYLNFTGYVKMSEVELINEIPEMPFLSNITFDVFPNANAILRTEPTTENMSKSIICILPAGTKNIEYIGKISGEESLIGSGNVWYYCNYIKPDGTSTFGYIYSPLTNNLSAISQNEEIVSSVFLGEKNNTSFLYINLSTMDLTLLILSVPTLIILYLFFKPTRIAKKFD